MGSAALYHMSKRGLKVLGLEQFSVAHDKGSSHGLSRIIRLAYHEDASYVPLLRRAFALWRELEAETDQELLTMTGCINTSLPTKDSVFDNCRLSAEEHGLQHEVLTPEQVSKRFPGYRLPPGFKALYQREGGILAPERCVAAHAAAAAARGAVIRERQAATAWRVDEASGNVLVTTERGTYRGRRLVATAGAWIPRLVPQLQALCKVERQVVAWFGDAHPAFSAEAFPVFVLHDEELGYYYGFPTHGNPGLKIGKFNHLQEEVDPDRQSREITPRDEEVMRAAVAKFFPQANGEMRHACVCVFTNTPDSHFIIDKHPEHPQVVVCSACSGHGFKFASVIGECLADLAQSGTTEHDISLHRLSRFLPRSNL
ncbi:hypothetical protein WJX81_006509 [Elliptochloris bilobata]|uniref:FAD dependent oxidoreductase domain-containing protein n=1 Tax=Elliptochloris bilobata TaxID=381761 RepID=A0AAW1SK81_9CHLO